jgi:cation:H+ antiporter
MGVLENPVVLIVLGLVLLIGGGQALVRGASGLALSLRISPLVVGLTVVAFGTSAPELAVCLKSALSGNTDLAVGNIVGSNIANILFILGISALVTPLLVSSQLIRLDVPLMIASVVAMTLMALDGRISRLDGSVLFGCLVCYTVWLIFQSRRASKKVQQEFKTGTKAIALGRTMAAQVGLVIIGLLFLGLGSNWLVSGAVQIAKALGVKELIIGLTVVAVGTSLPEVVTSIVASLKGQKDIAVGNIVGSNIFNVLCVLGLGSVFSRDGVAISSAALRFDIPIMLAVSIACLPIFFTGNEIRRWEGGLFFGYYVAYMAYLVLAASHSTITRTFGVIMLGFVVPLTAITLSVIFIRALRSSKVAIAPNDIQTKT